MEDASGNGLSGIWTLQAQLQYFATSLCLVLQEMWLCDWIMNISW